jgi:hypothetical protein
MFALNLTHARHWSLVLIISLISFAIVFGLVTPILSILACVAAILNLFFADQPLSVVYVLRILTSAALFFLGPGAYSVDARLFGLRVTVVPPRKYSN